MESESERRLLGDDIQCGGGPEKYECCRDGHHATETNLGKLIHGRCGKSREDDIVFPFEIARIIENDTETDSEGGKDLTGGLEPNLGVPQFAKVGIPHKSQAVVHRSGNLSHLHSGASSLDS